MIDEADGFILTRLVPRVLIIPLFLEIGTKESAEG